MVWEDGEVRAPEKERGWERAERGGKSLSVAHAHRDGDDDTIWSFAPEACDNITATCLRATQAGPTPCLGTAYAYAEERSHRVVGKLSVAAYAHVSKRKNGAVLFGGCAYRRGKGCIRIYPEVVDRRVQEDFLYLDLSDLSDFSDDVSLLPFFLFQTATRCSRLALSSSYVSHFYAHQEHWTLLKETSRNYQDHSFRINKSKSELSSCDLNMSFQKYLSILNWYKIGEMKESTEQTRILLCKRSEFIILFYQAGEMREFQSSDVRYLVVSEKRDCVLRWNVCQRGRKMLKYSKPNNSIAARLFVPDVLISPSVASVNLSDPSSRPECAATASRGF